MIFVLALMWSAGEFGVGIALSTSLVAYLLWRRRSDLPIASGDE
jgi:hypothetical protein